ncbi:MAG: hypothetical protein WCF67_10830 [Chitinophagaceae bacterium]
MTDTNKVSLTDKVISQIGLRLSDKKINCDVSPNARIFEFPQLANVFIMENDLYGNVMPKDSCFLAFHGSHGLIGKHLRVETLLKASMEEIKNMVETHNEG